jgi:tetratricopeptide (TPR) repeat protein
MGERGIGRKPKASLRSRPLRRAGIVLAFAAALAAAALIVMPRLRAPAAGPVASWQVDGYKQNRGPDDAAPADWPVRVQPDTVLRIKVSLDRPAGEVKFRLLVVRGGNTTFAPVESRTIKGMVLSLEERAEEMLGPQLDGAAELVWIGGGEAPGEAEASAAALEKRPARGFTVLRQAVVFEGWQKTGLAGSGGGATGNIEIAGCAALTRDGVCELGERRTVTVWGRGRPTVSIDDHAVASEPAEVGSGVRHVVTIPEAARTLTISAGVERISFSIGKAPGSPRLSRALAALGAGRLEEAETALGGTGDGGDAASPEGTAERLAERRVLARIARRRAKVGKDSFAAAQTARLAVGREARAAGRLSEAADDLLVVTFSLLIDTHDVAGARALLDEAEADAALAAETRVFWEYNHGLWARETGDLGTAFDDLWRARNRAERLDLGALSAHVASALPEVLALLGGVDEAVAMSPAPSGQAGCAAATAATNRGWARLIGGGDVEKAAVDLRDALALAGDECPEDRATLALNLSYAEQARGSAADAAKWLAIARAATRSDDARLKAWQDRLEIRLALSGDPDRALRAAERLTRRTPADPSPEIRFEAEFGRGRALQALGRGADAGAAFEHADEALDAWARTVRLGQGRDGLFVRLDTPPRTWLSWFAGQAEAAAPPARRDAEERLLRAALHSLSRWIRTLSPERGPEPTSQSPAPSPEPAARSPGEGDLWVLLHPLTTGVLAMAWSAGGLSHVRLPQPPAGAPALDARALLAPFQAEIGRAARLRLLVHRSFGGLSFGTVEMGPRGLAEATIVTYGLGLAVPAPVPSARPRPRAVVVLDPRGDLAGARMSSAGRDLVKKGFEVVELRGQSATRARVLEALQAPCADLFHFEGHGAHHGIDGNAAGLLLADGDLEVRDIRQLPCAPRQVVLAACDTAHPSGLALAHAFVERGAGAVLGASATLADDTAVAVMNRLYAGPEAAASFDLPAAVTGALRALRADGGNATAAAAGLRVLVP